MFRKISSSMDYPALWAGSAEKPSRWRRLDQLDRMLDGTFYEHLKYDFYEEEMMNGKMIPLLDRRPSSPYNLPAMVSHWSARKLWVGRHVPRLSHVDKEVTKIIDQIVATTKFNQVMMDATVLGSVGSVGITFRIDRSDIEPQVALKVWRAKYCTPTFDDFRNLVNLRTHYNVKGYSLLNMNPSIRMAADGTAIQADQEYWWVRDYGRDKEITYVPTPVADFNPVMMWHKDHVGPVIMKEVVHGLGVVPGVWIRNLSGSTDIDGAGTWDKAKNISIEIDYLLSQAARGTRYNCAPELVIVGQFAGGGDDVGIRSPASYIHLSAGVKQAEGESYEGGKAELLEMSGQGVKTAYELIDKLRNMALESIGATRKDPEKLKGVMSGSAMQFMDEDSHDLVMELRSSYGDSALELVRKVVRGLGNVGDPKGVKIEWPRLYQPTPEDLAHLIPGLVMAATPIQAPLEPEEALKFSSGAGGATAGTGTKNAAGKGEGTQGGRPSVKPTGGKSLGSLLEVEEASRYLRMQMDMDLLPDADEAGVTDSDKPTDTVPDPERREERPEDEGQNVSEPNPMDAGMSE